jgi:hypothetical protein
VKPQPSRLAYVLAVATITAAAWSGFIPGYRTPPPDALDLVERAIMGTCGLLALWTEARRGTARRDDTR